MFRKNSDSGYEKPADKVRMKTLVWGEKTLMTEFRLEKGGLVPLHSHPHEQTGYLVSGRMELVVDGEPYEVSPGDSWNIGPDVEHEGKALEESVAIEVFSPVREDYLPGS